MKILHDYEGREVRLTDERLAHILEHPEMVGLEEALGETLAQPWRVIQSLSDPQAWLYCGDAFILTAYLTDTIKKGQQLWPPRT